MKPPRSSKQIVRLAHADTFRTYFEIKEADGGDLPVYPECVAEERATGYKLALRVIDMQDARLATTRSL